MRAMPARIHSLGEEHTLHAAKHLTGHVFEHGQPYKEGVPASAQRTRQHCSGWSSEAQI